MKQKIMLFFTNMFIMPKCTGLPTKDETSQTIVRDLYCLFLYNIHHSLKL